jgi:hypothetical protein
MLESDSEGTEALATPSVEPDRWLKEGVPFAVLAVLERLEGPGGWRPGRLVAETFAFEPGADEEVDAL